MANEVKIPTLQEALSAIGNAHVFKGDFFTANTVAALGQKQGAIQAQATDQFNQLTADELTGPMVHDEWLTGTNLVITVPIIVPADGSFWADMSPTQSAGLGFSTPQRPVDAGIAIIPDAEIGGGLLYDGTSWARLAGNGVAAASGAAAAPKNALWIWRARISRGDVQYDQANGGKMIVPVTIQAKFATQAGVPEGMKLAAWGDPAALGVTGFLFSAAA